MPFRMVCQACQKRLVLQQDLSGKRIKCPGCGTAQTVPSLTATSEPAEKLPAAVAALLKQLRAPGVDQRIEAAAALGDAGCAAPAVAQALAKAMQEALQAHKQRLGLYPEKNLVLWDRAVEALGKLRAVAPGSLEAMTAVINVASFRALGALGPAARGAIQSVVEALWDKDSDVRWAAQQALPLIDPEWQKVAVPALIGVVVAALHDVCDPKRNAAETLLNRIAPDWRKQMQAQAEDRKGPMVAELLRTLLTDLFSGDLKALKARREEVLRKLKNVDPKWDERPEVEQFVAEAVKKLQSGGNIHTVVYALGACPWKAQAARSALEAVASNNRSTTVAQDDLMDELTRLLR